MSNPNALLLCNVVQFLGLYSFRILCCHACSTFQPQSIVLVTKRRKTFHSLNSLRTSLSQAQTANNLYRPIVNLVAFDLDRGNWGFDLPPIGLAHQVDFDRCSYAGDLK